MSNSLQHTFKKNRYVVVRDFFDLETRHLLYTYLILNSRRLDVKVQLEPDLCDPDWDGYVPNQHKDCSKSYCWYGDPLMDTVLLTCTERISDLISKNLVPTYSYCRLYKHKETLKKHTDRDSCEYSTSICLGGDPWPIFVEGVPVDLTPGDLLLYKGCELEHWREEFQGEQCGQLFLHYNISDRPITGYDGKLCNSINDGRISLGVPVHVTEEYIRSNLSTDKVDKLL